MYFPFFNNFPIWFLSMIGCCILIFAGFRLNELAGRVKTGKNTLYVLSWMILAPSIFLLLILSYPILVILEPVLRLVEIFGN